MRGKPIRRSLDLDVFRIVDRTIRSELDGMAEGKMARIVRS